MFCFLRTVQIDTRPPSKRPRARTTTRAHTSAGFFISPLLPPSSVFRLPSPVLRPMSQPTVQSGLYRFFTQAELNTERLRYKDEVKKSNSSLVGASINGQSYQFSSAGREMTLPEWADELAAAYLQLGITDYGAPSPNSALARF